MAVTRTLLQRKKATLARASLKRCRCVRPLGWVIPSYSSLLFLFLFLIDRPFFGSIKRSGDLKLHIVFWFVSRGEKNRLSTSFLLTTTDNEKKTWQLFFHFPSFSIRSFRPSRWSPAAPSQRSAWRRRGSWAGSPSRLFLGVWENEFERRSVSFFFPSFFALRNFSL